MKHFLPFYSCFFCGSLLFAQYPSANYWFAELGGATPISKNYQIIYRGPTQKPTQWYPSNQWFVNLGFHMESLEGHFFEPYLEWRYAGQELKYPKFLGGFRFGTGKNRWRFFTEGNYGSRNTSGGGGVLQDEAAGVSYGVGYRYHITSRMSVQIAFLRNHFSQ